eukprot:gene23320-27741_t
MAQHWYEPHRLTENKTRQNMFKLNLKIALRNILKNRVSSFINVTGLAIGLAASLMLL